MRSSGSLLALIVASSLVGGCKPSDPPASETAKPSEAQSSPPKPAPPVPQTVARLRWLGIKRIAVETNSTHFMEIWNLPETRRLEAQTLDKLALFLARAENTNSGAPVTNYQSFVAHSRTASLWRPLLDDLAREESYLEVARFPGRPLDFALSLHLDAQRAALWETNVTAALALTPDIRALPSEEGTIGWELPDSNRVALASMGGWTTLSLTSESGVPLLRDFLTRIQRDQAPFKPSMTNFWVEGDLNSAGVAEALALDWKPPAGWPAVSLTIMGDGESVRTHGQLDFPKPLAGNTEPWVMPTNFIQGPISSFSAIRGIKPWLETLKAWNDLDVGPPPDQLFSWALQGPPMNTFFAAPQPDASNQVRRISEFVLQKGAKWFSTNEDCRFEKSSSGCGLQWKGPPHLYPFLEPGVDGPRTFILAGSFPFVGTNEPLPAELLQVLTPTNLVAYSWEITDMRVQHLVFISQFIRLVAGREQFPSQSATMFWLRAMSPKLANCVSIANQVGPGRISMTRRSAIGLSALELHLVAEWLESPQFPMGAFSLQTPALTYELAMPKPARPSVPAGAHGPDH